MRFPLFFLAIFGTISVASATPAQRIGVPVSGKISAGAKSNRLICKTGSEARPSNQPLELYFQYHLPISFEAEDPTMPFGRQVMVLQARPLVQLHFKRSLEAAGDNGEKLEAMTCAFARRALSVSEPNHVQIFLPPGQTHWLTQGIGQRIGPKQLSLEHAVMVPAGDWSFASQFEKVFFIDLEDTKNFVTTQLPKAL